MTSVLKLNDADGSVFFDSANIVGGVVADVINVPSNAVIDKSYPYYAGRSVQLIPLGLYSSTIDPAFTADTSLGYPRVTGGAVAMPRRFMVMVK